MKFVEDMEDDVVLQLDLFSDTQRNGEFKPMALKLPQMGVCTGLKTYYGRFINNSIITNVHTDFKFNNGSLCPIPKGVYWLKNVIFNPNEWLSILPTGFIKVQISLLRNKEYGGGFSLVVNIESVLFPI